MSRASFVQRAEAAAAQLAPKLPPMSILAFCRRRSGLIAVSLSVLLAAVYLVWQPQTTDLAAQTFRADLWDRAGFVIWNPYWYGGHLVPGYSLLYPPLGAWLGPALLGAASAVAAAALFARLALETLGQRAWLGVIWFGAASTVPLYSGRTTFALGLALALAALLAVRRDRPLLAAAGGIATAAASPVAALFLALACAAVLLASRLPLGVPTPRLPTRAAAGAMLGAAVPIAALALAFPSGGFHPFGFSAFIWIPLVAAFVAVLAAPRHPVLVWGALLYAGLGLAAVLFDTALGGNATRLGATFGGPLLAILLVGRRPVLLALVALPLLYWQWEVTVKDVVRAERDPAVHAAYFEPLLEQLEGRPRHAASPLVHVSPTRSRWEAVYVAERVPISRGWLRQAESDDFPLFRDGPLEPRAYVRWLRDRGVGYVAISDADPDYLAELELELERSGEFPLSLVWEDVDWRLYEVAAPSSPRLDALEVRPDGFTVRFEGTRVSVPLRYTPYFEVVEGSACVEPDPASDARTLLTRAPGSGESVTVQARLSLAGVAGRDRYCGGPDATGAVGEGAQADG